MLAGKVDVLDWAWTLADFSREDVLGDVLLQPAASHGRLEVLKWAAEQLGDVQRWPVLASSCILILAWLDSQELPRHVMTPVRAAETGSLPVIVKHQLENCD